MTSKDMSYQSPNRINKNNNMTKTATYDIGGLLVDLKLERLDHKGGLLLLTGFCNGLSVRTSNPELESVQERFIKTLYAAGDLGDPDHGELNDMLDWIGDNLNTMRQ